MGTHPIFESDFYCLTENEIVTGRHLGDGFEGTHPVQQGGNRQPGGGIRQVCLTTDDADVFEVCFKSISTGGFSNDPKFHEVSILVRKGVEAKSYVETAKTEKLKPLEVELRRLE